MGAKVILMLALLAILVIEAVKANVDQVNFGDTTTPTHVNSLQKLILDQNNATEISKGTENLSRVKRQWGQNRRIPIMVGGGGFGPRGNGGRGFGGRGGFGRGVGGRGFGGRGIGGRGIGGGRGGRG